MVNELLSVTWVEMFVFAFKVVSAFGLAALCTAIPAAILVTLFD